MIPPWYIITMVAKSTVLLGTVILAFWIIGRVEPGRPALKAGRLTVLALIAGGATYALSGTTASILPTVAIIGIVATLCFAPDEEIAYNDHEHWGMEVHDEWH